MKICLLKCGSVFDTLQHISGDYHTMFLRFFNSNSIEISLDIYKVYHGEYPNDLSIYDGFISSGSLAGVYENDPWIKTYQEFIKKLYDSGYKHIGICFGHQMIAQALGGKVEKAKVGWGLGIKKAKIKEYKHWMNRLPADEINLIVSHQDQVVKLPSNATVLASNEHCPLSMFSVDEHFLGIQAHPEFTKKFSRAAIEYRRTIVDPGIIEKALESLSNSTDEKRVIKWIENFFKGSLH